MQELSELHQELADKEYWRARHQKNYMDAEDRRKAVLQSKQVVQNELVKCKDILSSRDAEIEDLKATLRSADETRRAQQAVQGMYPLVDWTRVHACLLKAARAEGVQWNHEWLEFRSWWCKDRQQRDDDFNKICLGCGSFGGALKGILEDGTLVAVKFNHEDMDFSQEFTFTALTQGDNMTPLLGWSCRKHQEISTNPSPDRYAAVPRDFSTSSCTELDRVMLTRRANYGSLNSFLLERRTNIYLGTLPTMLRAFAAAAHAVHSCCHHRGVLHFDLHPGNLLIHKPTQSSVELWIADLGCAKLMKINQNYWKPPAPTSPQDFAWAVPYYSPYEWWPPSERPNDMNIVVPNRWTTGDDIHEWGVTCLVFFFHLNPVKVHQQPSGVWPSIVADQVQLKCAEKAARKATLEIVTKLNVISSWQLRDSPQSQVAMVNLCTLFLSCSTPRRLNNQAESTLKRPGTMLEVADLMTASAAFLETCMT